MASLVSLHTDLARLHHEELLRQAAELRLARVARGERQTLPGRVRDYVVAHRPRARARQRQTETPAAAALS
jgi:hypothetical protein